MKIFSEQSLLSSMHYRQIFYAQFTRLSEIKCFLALSSPFSLLLCTIENYISFYVSNLFNYNFVNNGDFWVEFLKLLWPDFTYIFTRFDYSWSNIFANLLSSMILESKKIQVAINFIVRPACAKKLDQIVFGFPY